MSIAITAATMIDGVRRRGLLPALVTVSPDVYRLWEQQNAGIEPCTVSGISICIRDNYKPQTMLILGEKISHPS